MVYQRHKVIVGIKAVVSVPTVVRAGDMAGVNREYLGNAIHLVKYNPCLQGSKALLSWISGVLVSRCPAAGDTSIRRPRKLRYHTCNPALRLEHVSFLLVRETDDVLHGDWQMATMPDDVYRDCAGFDIVHRPI